MIRVTTNRNIFGLYCYLNTVGYDEENNKEGMHPIRKDVRGRLSDIAKNKNLSSYIDYYKMKYVDEKIHLFHFNSATLCMSADSSFKFIKSNYSTKLLPTLNHLLKSFYSDFSLDILWNEISKSHTNVCHRYSEISDKIIAFTKANILEKQKENVQITVIPNLLESYFRSKSILIDNELYLLFGPYKNNRYLIEGIIHEYLHLLVNPVVEKYAKEISENEDYFKKIHHTEQVESSYGNWKAFFNESLVRALTFMVYKNTNSISSEEISHYLENIRSHGFILSAEIIQEFENTLTPVSIEKVLCSTLARI